MCQILQIKPGVSFPANLLERTCDINKDGFGLVVRHKGQFIIERDIAKNDHKKIGALLHKWKDKPRYLHLRHATKGAVNKPNNHPFVVFEKK
jgi:predicted glutamine amidotransferase